MTFYKPSSQRRIKKFIKKTKAFTIEEGAKHVKATHNETGTVIQFPRSNFISNGVTKDVCEKLQALGYDKDEIERKII